MNDKPHNDELIIGICGGIGADIDYVVNELENQFNRFDFVPVSINLSKVDTELGPDTERTCLNFS